MSKDLSQDLEPPSMRADPYAELAYWMPRHLMGRALALARHPLSGVRAADAPDVVGEAVTELLEDVGGWEGLVTQLRLAMGTEQRPTRRELEDTLTGLLAPRIKQKAQNFRRRKENSIVTLAADFSRSLEEIVVDPNDAFSKAEWKMELKRLVRAVRKLRGGKLLVFVTMSDLSHAEIAALLGVSEAILSSRLHQARERAYKAQGGQYKRHLPLRAP